MTSTWRRLSPRMLLVTPVRLLKQMLVVVVVSLVGTGGDNPLVGLAIASGFLLLAGLAGFVQWRTTTYAVSEDRVRLRSGLVSRKEVSAPLDRVRSVDLEAPVLHRLLGLSKVTIGTGVDNSRIELDALGAADARMLRDELLRHTLAVQAPADLSVPWPDGLVGDAITDLPPPTSLPVEMDEVEVARFTPAWLRYAPFGLSGLAAASALIGFVWQLGDDIGFVDAAVDDGRELLARTSVVLLVGAGGLGLLILWPLFSMASYVLQWFGLRVTRRSDATMHVTRGLVTARSTTIDEARVRGVQMSDQLLLRLVDGSSLSALATGVGQGTQAVLPPAPRLVVEQVAALLLEQDGLLSAPLRRHGFGARVRRHTRAQWPTVVGSALLIAGAAQGWVSWWWLLAVPVVGGVGVLLAEDRYRNLGHTLLGGFLVTRSGSVIRTTVALERAGVIGVVLVQSFFQRRRGLATLRVTTAAGSEGYDVIDLPLQTAVALADQAVPGLLTPFVSESRYTASWS